MEPKPGLVTGCWKSLVEENPMPAGRPRSDQQLDHCREEGLQCQDCVQRVAETMTRICADVTPSLARQLFVAIYPEQTCAKMSGAFAQAVSAKQAPRRMPMRELRIVAAAEVARATAAVA